MLKNFIEQFLGSSKNRQVLSLIGPGCVIRGDVTFTSGIRIDGEVAGDVVSTGEGAILIVGATGNVRGKLDADHIVVNGTVDGPVTARVLLELEPGARVEGEVSYKSIEIHKGARASGSMKPMSDAQVPAGTAASAPYAQSAKSQSAKG